MTPPSPTPADAERRWDYDRGCPNCGDILTLRPDSFGERYRCASCAYWQPDARTLNTAWIAKFGRPDV